MGMGMKEYNYCPTAGKGDNPILTIFMDILVSATPPKPHGGFDKTLQKGGKLYGDVHE